MQLELRNKNTILQQTEFSRAFWLVITCDLSQYRRTADVMFSSNRAHSFKNMDEIILERALQRNFST